MVKVDSFNSSPQTDWSGEIIEKEIDSSINHYTPTIYQTTLVWSTFYTA